MFRRISFIFIVIFYSIFDSKGQCKIEQFVPIPDESSIALNILVAGSTNNQLGVNGQDLCQVNLKFTHQVIGDLDIYLISPFGNIVQLVGPSGNAIKTTGTVWDIKFVNGIFAAAPDLGIDEVWDSNQTWGFNQFYNGIYYPATGDLADFTGSVNGTWTLLIEDNEGQDIGEISLFELIFCDDTGINCDQCEPSPANPKATSLSVCKGKNLPSSDFQFNYINPAVSISGYKTDYVIFGKGINFGLLKNNTIPTLDSGNYQLCLLTYSKADSTSLPGLSFPNKLKYSEEIIRKGVCGQFGGCLNLNILPVSDTVKRRVEICRGDTLSVYGGKFFQEGKYQVTSTSGQCDTIISLSLDVLNLDPVISPNQPLITCSNQKVNLTAQVNEPLAVLNYQWTTPNGFISSNPDLNTIEVTAAGKYYVKVTSQRGCTFVDSIIVVSDVSIPQVNITSGSLDCKNLAVNITFSSPSTIMNAVWSSLNSFVNIPDGIRVNKPGQYILTVTDDINCTAIVPVNITQDITKPYLEATIDTIDCIKKATSLSVSDSTNIKSVLVMQNGFTNINTPYSVSGNYSMELVGFNSCKDTFNFEVIDRSYIVDVKLEDDTLTCKERQKYLKPILNQNVDLYQWRRNGSNISALDSILIDDSGNYSVTVTDSLGCSGIANASIRLDTMLPQIIVSPRLITCSVDSTYLYIENPKPRYTYRWSLGSFLATEDTVLVRVAGSYSVIVTDQNQCTNEASLRVSPGTDLPIVTFTSDTLKCDLLSSKITPSDTTNLFFRWLNPGIMLNGVNDKFGKVTQGGGYRVEVTNTTTFCRQVFQVPVVDVRQFPTLTIAADTIGCAADSTQIIFSSNYPYKTISWTDKVSFISLNEDPFVNLPGKYYVAIVDSFGCAFKDSVEVFKNRDLPQFDTKSETFTCDTSAIRISVEDIDPNLKYEWFRNGTLIDTITSIKVKKLANYTLKATNSRGCSDIKVVQIPVDTIKPNLSLTPFGILNCTEREMEITANSNQILKSAKWIGPGIDSTKDNYLKLNLAGVYTFTAVNESSCIAKIEAIVKDSSTYLIVTGKAKPITCDSLGELSIKINGQPKRVEWFGPSPISNNVLSEAVSLTGKYYYQVTSFQNCITKDSIVVGLDTLRPVITSLTNKLITCDDKKVTIGVVTPSLLDKVIWEDFTNINIVTVEVDKPKIYKGQLIGRNGCITNFSIDVKQDIDPPSYQLKGDTIDCNNIKIDLELISNDDIVEVNWKDEDNVNHKGKKVKVKLPGKYHVFVKSGNGCFNEDSIFINSNLTTPRIELQDTFRLPCDLSPINIFVSSQDSITTYRWEGLNSNFNSTESSPQVNKLMKVRLFAASFNGCSSIDSTVISIEKTKPIYSFKVDKITCSQKEATLQAMDVSDDNLVQWRFGNQIISNDSIIRVITPGNYSLKILDKNQCKDSIPFKVDIDTISPRINLTQDKLFECSNKQVNLLVSGNGDKFKWYTSNGRILSDSTQPKILIDKSGIYFLESTNLSNDCISRDSIILEYKTNSIKSLDFLAVDPVCFGDNNGYISIQNIIGKNPPYQVFIDNRFITEASDLLSGDHIINVKDTLGCTLDSLVRLKDGVVFNISLPQDTSIRLGDVIKIGYNSETSIDTEKLIWSVGNNVLCDGCNELFYEGLESIELKLEAQDANECIASDIMKINIISKLRPDLPNVILLNGSPQNSKYFVTSAPYISKILLMEVFDPWGNKVFRKENFDAGNPDEGWDGSFLGKQVNPGVFVAHIKIQLKDASIIEMFRDLTVLK